jgi:hypothetical protein
VRYGSRGGDERCARAVLHGANCGLELGRGGALVEYVGEMHKWVKIKG